MRYVITSPHGDQCGLVLQVHVFPVAAGEFAEGSEQGLAGYRLGRVDAPDIDEAAAKEAKIRAEAAMADKKSDLDYARAKAELIEAVAKIETIKKLRKRK